jgi:hypothetical protein
VSSRVGTLPFRGMHAQASRVFARHAGFTKNKPNIEPASAGACTAIVLELNVRARACV